MQRNQENGSSSDDGASGAPSYSLLPSLYKAPKQTETTMRVVLALAAMLTACGTAAAQERVMNTGAPGSLRTWPISGKWIVSLIRTDERQLVCAIFTGVRTRDEFYLWGLRRVGQQ